MVKRTITTRKQTLPRKAVVTTTVVNSQRRVPNRRRKRIAGPRKLMPTCAVDYAKCVLDPHGGAMSKVPDGSCHSVLVEYDLTVTGTPDTNGNLAVMAFPGLPCSFMGLIGTFNGPNREGSIISGVTTGSITPGILFPFPDYFSGVTQAAVGSTVLYNGQNRISFARAVSYKLEVTPAGAILQQGGSTVSARVPLMVSWIQGGVDNGTQAPGGGYAGASKHGYLAVDGIVSSYAGMSSFPDSRTTSGTETSVLIGMPEDAEFTRVLPQFLDVTTGSVQLRGDSLPIGSGEIVLDGSGFGQITKSGPGWYYASMIPSSNLDIAAFGNFWMPEETVGLAWAGQGLPTGQSYNFRVRVCMEMCVDHQTSVYRPFVTPPEKAEPAVIAAVRDIYRELPPSMPKESSSPGWWARLTGAVTGASSLVASLGIPVLSPTAGLVNQFTKLLG